MATLSELETRRDALREIAARGELRVTLDGQTIEYRSLDELQRAITMVKQQISAMTNVQPIRAIRFYGGKGI
ncbi:MAG: hypothetical protein P1U37_06630 [Minwuia sp.]|nr:hypothetical protein [Minwuia sp.]